MKYSLLRAVSIIVSYDYNIQSYEKFQFPIFGLIVEQYLFLFGRRIVTLNKRRTHGIIGTHGSRLCIKSTELSDLKDPIFTLYANTPLMSIAAKTET